MNGTKILRFTLIVPIIVLVLVVLWGFLDATEGASATTVWNYTWPATTGGTRGGYIVDPATARRSVGFVDEDAALLGQRSPDGRYPAVLLLHEWWGLNLETVRLSEHLAARGYIVLAPDLLRGKLSVTVPGALFSTLSTPHSRIVEDLDLAYNQLSAIPEVDPARIAVIGFSFGGTEAMRLGVRNAAPKIVGTFYGPHLITDEKSLGNLGSSVAVFGAFGGSDRSIPADDIAAFRGLLSGKEEPVAIQVYDNVGGAFVSPQSLRTDPTAAEAWRALLTFLSTYL